VGEKGRGRSLKVSLGVFRAVGVAKRGGGGRRWWGMLFLRYKLSLIVVRAVNGVRASGLGRGDVGCDGG